MNDSYLEVTFRHGRVVAAYLYLPRAAGQKSARSRRVEPGLVIDFAASGRPIGIEITAPARLSLVAINGVLEELSLTSLAPADLSPLVAA
jgi:hypothetical protein